ncbi:histidinol-phosphate transaminase [Niallia sp. 01092]|uniref:histidinol-phosphate transaminase n=1 Tax=unclassified Niallia TaxID=2837522 RepID=UPI003FD4D299
MKWKEQLLNLTPYQPGKTIDEVKKQFNLDEIVKLASNENPFGSSSKVKEALQNVDGSFALYPDGYATNLRFALAEFLQVAPEQLVLGNGSDEIILMISRALLKPGLNTVMASHTFGQYKHNAIVDGAEVREIPLTNEGHHDLDGMLAAIDENTSVVWLCSPNNPTGTYISDEKLVPFLKSVPSEVLVVLDEAYYEYVVAEDYYDALTLVKQFDNLIVLRTFSKIYGLASFRVGYGIANEEFIKSLEPIREPFNVNTLGQIATETALKDQEFVESCKKKNREGMEQFYAFCEEHGLTYFPSQTNFILIDFKVDGNEVFQYFMKNGYIVRSGVPLNFPTSVRITVGSKEQNEGLIKVMSQFIEEKAAVVL